MGNAKLSFDVTFVHRTCPDCGQNYAVPDGFTEERRKDHRTFYCPNGHQRYFPEENDVEKLRKDLARETQRREMAEREVAMEKKRTAEAEAANGRLKKRASAGVCSCCKRTFQNVARHMATKHPDDANQGE